MNVQTKFMYPLRWTLEGFLVILLKKHEDFVNMFWRSHFWFNYLKGVWSLHFRLSWFILLHHLLLQWVHLCPIIHPIVSPQSLLGCCLISSSFFFFLHAFHLSFAGFTGLIYKFTNFYFCRLEYLGITLTCFFALLTKSDLGFFYVSINTALQNVVTHCFGCLVIFQFILRKLTYSRSFLLWK